MKHVVYIKLGKYNFTRYISTVTYIHGLMSDTVLSQSEWRSPNTYAITVFFALSIIR